MNMLRILNLSLLCITIGLAFILIQKRYTIRLAYVNLGRQRRLQNVLSVEQSRLQIEKGTYLTTIIAPNAKSDNLGLVQPTKTSITEIK